MGWNWELINVHSVSHRANSLCPRSFHQNPPKWVKLKGLS